MGEYLQRRKSFYGAWDVDISDADNRYILEWWSSDHDALIRQLIAEYRWNWPWMVADRVVECTSSKTLELWKAKDPACERSVWYNALLWFVLARAAATGMDRLVKKPRWKICRLCKLPFVEDSLPMPLFERLGADRIDHCAPCMGCLLQGSGNPKASESQIIKYLQSLAGVLGRVPAQGFGEGMKDLLDYDTSSRTAILRVLRKKPTVRRVKELFDSWLNALVEAGVLEDGARRSGRGIQTIARDGHVCLSLGERTIDEWLFDHGIVHEREPHYPEGNFRADFLVNGIFIEYFGLSGNADYDAKVDMKKRICRKHGIRIISLYPRDLLSNKRLESKLQCLFGA